MKISHRIALFYGLALAFSWSFWLSQLALGLQVRPGSTTSHLPGLMGPMLAALVTVAVTDGRAGMRRLLDRCVRLPARPGLVALAIAAPVLVAALTFALLLALGDSLPSPAEFLAYPGLPTGLGGLSGLLLMLVLNGYGEEVGWRGYALETLLPAVGRFRATLLIAVMWMVWHLPLFWLNLTMAGLLGPILIGWVIALLLGAFAMSRLYLMSGRSLLAVSLWHVSYNLSVATPATEGVVAAVVSTLVMIWGAVVAGFWFKGRNRPETVAPRP